MERTRERSIRRIREMLERAGFFVSDAHGIRPSSFDLAARRDSLLLLVKVLKNIDTLNRNEATRLLELGRLFPAVAIVVGETSGASELEPGVVYTRYEAPIIREETLQEYVEKALAPFLLSSPGGVFARIDGGHLRELREARALSLGAMAAIAGVSRHSVQLYEDGSGAEMSVVARIEEYFGEPIAVPIAVFDIPMVPRGARVGSNDARRTSAAEEERGGSNAPEPTRARTGDPLRDGVFRELDGMGWEVAPTARAPFDAFTRTPPSDLEREIILTAIGSLRTAIHRAEVLHQLARVAEGHAMFVVQESIHRNSIGGLPILSVSELKRHRDRDDLIDAITERERS
ncbi:transcriptional regulator, XRE family [mine drainage metagenome]|uniref:Transcriptional regulator, XRE family n=1 Tax=mine drainage metagenome TaxID=410659 RepID=T0ZYJ7_9ZZZZ